MYVNTNGKLSHHDVSMVKFFAAMVESMEEEEGNTHVFSPDEFPFMAHKTLDFVQFLQLLSTCDFQGFTKAQLIELLTMGQYVHAEKSFFDALFEAFTVHLDEIHDALKRCETAEQRRVIMTTENFFEIDTLIGTLLEQHQSSLELQDQPAFKSFKKFIVQWMGEKTAYFMSIMRNGAKLIADIVREKEEEIAHLLKDNARLQGAKSRLEKKNEDLNDEVEKVQLQNKTLNKQAVQTRNLKTSVKELDSLKTMLTEAETKILDLNALCESHREDFSELEKKYDDVQGDNEDAHQRLEKKDARIVELKKQAAAQNMAVMKLQCEKQQLQDENQQLLKALRKCEQSMADNNGIIMECIKRRREEDGDDEWEDGARKSPRRGDYDNA